MKTLTTRIVIATLSLCAFVCVGPRLHAAQPEMNDAISQLEAAKGEHSVEHLEKAKHHLEEAAHNKDGERVDAIRSIDEALGFAHKGEHKRMEEAINRAIRQVREGKRDAR